VKHGITVILDSNFLFIPSQFNLDIFTELMRVLNRNFTPVVLSSTIKELKLIQQKASMKEKKQATLALGLASKSQQVDIKKGTSESPDDIILRVAKEHGWCVATNDKALRRRLRENNIAVIFLRQQSHLEVEGNI
jgi:rRNA-processing protein FCF1